MKVELTREDLGSLRNLVSRSLEDHIRTARDPRYKDTYLSINKRASERYSILLTKIEDALKLVN